MRNPGYNARHCDRSGLFQLHKTPGRHCERSEAISTWIKEMKQSYVYIMTYKSNRVLYTGVTTNFIRWVTEHKNKSVEGFTKKYNVEKVVYYEAFDSLEYAIQSEKQIKGGSREKKIKLIESINKEWKDLYESLV